MDKRLIIAGMMLGLAGTGISDSAHSKDKIESVPQEDFVELVTNNSNSELDEENTSMSEFGLIDGEIIEPKDMSDVTAHIFFSIHNPHKKLETETPTDLDTQDFYDCQLSIYRSLEDLFREGKISAVFFESYNQDSRYQEDSIPISPSLEGVSDRIVLQAMDHFSRQGIPQEAYILASLYGNRFLFGGWEDRIIGNKESKEEFFRQREEIKKEYLALGYLVQSSQINLNYEETQRKFAELGERYRTLSSRFGVRTSHAYNYSLENAQRWFEENPDMPKGYAIVIGGMHKFFAEDYETFVDHVNAQQEHPEVRIYQCLDDETLRNSAYEEKHRPELFLERLEALLQQN